MTMVQQGWFEDPDDAEALRYWDGSAWTDHRAPRTPSYSFTAGITPNVRGNPFLAVRTAIWRATDFKGRASRSEYWWFFAFYLASAVALLVVGTYVEGRSDADSAELVSGVVNLLIFVGLWPLVAVASRRMHDGGRSALWLLIGFVPIAGLAVHVWMLTPSRGVNRWGPPASRST